MTQLLIHRPGDTTLTIDPAQLTLEEWDVCEEFTGWTVQEWWQQLIAGKANAYRFAWWIGHRHGGHEISDDLSTIEFKPLAYTYEFTTGEAETETDEVDPDSPTGAAETPGG